MRYLLAVLVLVPPICAAQDWQGLTGAEIAAALTARVLTHDGRATQQFNADGSTVHATDRPS